MTTRNQCQFWDCDETIPSNHFLCSARDHYAGYKAGTTDQCPACGTYKDSGNADCCMYEEMRSLRRKLARANNSQEFIVFSNETLQEMARNRPMTPEAMLEITGVGPSKLERYGADFLRLMRERAGGDANQQHPHPQPHANSAQRDDREFPADKDADRFFVYILLLNNGEYYVGQTREIHERLLEHRNNQSRSTRRKEPKLQWFTTVRTRSEAADLETELQQLNSNANDRREINRWIVDFKQLYDQLDYTPHKPQA
ncbi:MAG: HRDC domain-containing protein [Dehalococcoidia bacterium]|nr:HRDC domain-containing protein [Dehalococcoidia bacterium]